VRDAFTGDNAGRCRQNVLALKPPLAE